VTFSGKWHGFFSVMWRDRSGAWGRPFSQGDPRTAPRGPGRRSRTRGASTLG